ncbi:hypothetical protein C5Z25_07095 [Lactobacillus sp. CBA3605]|uniref:hypothetical protein n=1 Tax=Lactobacillus sp. CBA3605 TaxID=2099788 RepID=UPI000CFBDA7B|nr:hypothetical protein [Lactobacillus sp. CBA3605]AVK61548.1 hypothetical protein C5Z25_07095 [Lactobacillus sp. CBA3605]
MITLANETIKTSYARKQQRSDKFVDQLVEHEIIIYILYGLITFIQFFFWVSFNGTWFAEHYAIFVLIYIGTFLFRRTAIKEQLVFKNPFKASLFLVTDIILTLTLTPIVFFRSIPWAVRTIINLPKYQK